MPNNTCQQTFWSALLFVYGWPFHTKIHTNQNAAALCVMSKNINVGCLKFPSGRPLGSALEDGKKLSQIEKTTLTEGHDKTASANGMDLPWDQAIEALKAEANKDVPIVTVLLYHITAPNTTSYLAGFIRSQNSTFPTK